MQYACDTHNTYWDGMHTLHMFSFVELVFDNFPKGTQGNACMPMVSGTQ